MRARLQTILDRLRGSYWFIPTLMSIGAVLLALLDMHLDGESSLGFLPRSSWIFGGGAEAARSLLSVIAGSIITVAGTTFSITVAALSMASSQFGPRLLRNFMRDRGNQVVLGVFTATFLYSLIVLRTVRGTDDANFVPHFSVTVAVAMAIFSVGVLIYFVHHIAESIQVPHVVQMAGEELDQAVARLFPKQAGHSTEEDASTIREEYAVTSKHVGYLQLIDTDSLLKLAVKRDLHFSLCLRPGEYALPGARLLLANRELDAATCKSVRGAFTLGKTRTPQQDAVYAFLQVADIAMHALSPSMNDPLTAILCIDRITTAMCVLADRSLPAPGLLASDGKVRLLARPYDYWELVDAAYGYISSSSGHSQVTHYLCRQLRTVIDRANEPQLRFALTRQLTESSRVQPRQL